MIFITLGKGFSYLFQLSLTYTYGAAAAGIFTLWFTTLHIASFLSRWGLDILVVQLIPKYKNNPKYYQSIVKQMVKSVTIFTLVFMAFWYVGYEWFSELLSGSSDLTKSFQLILVILLPMNILFLFAGILRGFGYVFSFSSIQHFSLPFLSFVLLFLAIKIFGYSNTLTPVVAFTIGIGLSSLMAIFLVMKKVTLQKSNSQISDNIFSIATPFALSNLALFLISWMDTLFIGYYLTPEDVGIFNLILRVSKIISLPMMGINSVIGPQISSAYYSNQFSTLIKNIRYSIITGAGSSAPIFGGILLFQNQILSFFGPEFSEAVLPFIILAAAHFIHTATGSAGLSLQMMGHAKEFQYILGSAVFLKVILAMILIPSFGVIGATTSILITTVYWKSTTWFILSKRLKSYKKSMEFLR